MARPMVLVQEDLLSEMWYKNAQGVPVLAIIRQHELEEHITAPTLTKLLSYMTAMESANEQVASIIYNSLFPTWLTDKQEELSIVSQPSEHYYTGKMPLGKWIKRGEELPKPVEPKKSVPSVKPATVKRNPKAKR